MRIAILDLGTNTFNLLIADTENRSNGYLHHSKEAAKLGEGGINDRKILPQAQERGLTALENHFKTIKKFKAEKVYAFATSAIRDASNGKEFLRKISDRFQLYVNIIPGEREAELIYKGVRQSYQLVDQKALILDIGGGSNECIIADNNRIYWKESYNLGMARLLEKFNPSDPISLTEIKEVEEYLEKEMSSLFEAANSFPPALLLGASGSFETFFSLLTHKLPTKYPERKNISSEIEMEDYRGLHQILLSSTLEERKNMEGMEPVRVEMIVLASVFVNFVISRLKINRLIQSNYALKEGVIAEILNF